MFEDRGDCAVCDGWGWLISGRRVDGKPLFKRCEFCNRSRNRRIVLAFIVASIALLILVRYLWIV